MKEWIGVLMLSIGSLFFVQNMYARKFVPPGTEKVADSVYLDKQLLTWVIHWVQKNLNKEEYQKALPDSRL